MDKTARERMRRYRDRNKSVTLSGSVTGKDVTVDTERAAKLLLICNALDKSVTGLSGQKVNLLTMVRYGISGPTMESVREQLT